MSTHENVVSDSESSSVSSEIANHPIILTAKRLLQDVEGHQLRLATGQYNQHLVFSPILRQAVFWHGDVDLHIRRGTGDPVELFNLLTEILHFAHSITTVARSIRDGQGEASDGMVLLDMMIWVLEEVAMKADKARNKMLQENVV